VIQFSLLYQKCILGWLLFYYTTKLKKKKLNYSSKTNTPENIKILLYDKQNPEKAGPGICPAPRLRGGAPNPINQKEGRRLSSKSEFVSSQLAHRFFRQQTFIIVLPNLIHKSQKKNLK